MVVRVPAGSELGRVARQLGAAYKAAYTGLMDAGYLAALPEDHWVPILKNSIDEGGTCLVAELKGEILGTAVFGPPHIECAPGDIELYAIYLSPQYVGQGVGGALCDEAERHMVAQGSTGCVLEVLEANRRAALFYTARGYETLAHFVVEENGMTLPCLRMRKALVSGT